MDQSVICSRQSLGSSQIPPILHAAFDATAFIGALEQAVDELIPLRKDVSQHTQQAEKRVEAAERQYTAKVKELRDNFNVRQACSSTQHNTVLTASIIYYAGCQ
jgi:hypothetical protein